MKKTILIVEDDRALIDALEYNLTQEGYQVLADIRAGQKSPVLELL